MAKKTYHGSCHCGRVKFEAAIDLSEGTGKCNCTSCWKKRLWTCRAKPEDFRAISGAEEMSGYVPGRAIPGGGFCKHCGVLTYNYVDVAEWNPTAWVSISLAALDDLDPSELAEAPVKYMDGRNDDWYNTPKETRHL